jgi:hypothetical protein
MDFFMPAEWLSDLEIQVTNITADIRMCGSIERDPQSRQTYSSNRPRRQADGHLNILETSLDNCDCHWLQLIFGSKHNKTRDKRQ